MNKILDEQMLDDKAYELLVAEEELILHAQMLIQRLLRTHRVSQKELARRMGVGESYVSQMLGLSPRNLTLRTIARVMSALGERATLVLDDQGAGHQEAERAAASDASNASPVAGRAGSAHLSQVWGELVELPTRGKAKRGSETDAKAYASYDPPVREMEMALAA